uniref:Ribosomal RNA-processing protein 43 n=2 Tax=Caenorhabditis tropicalis TaxID=1561998 RepID=A0A1I7TV28_9PELO
MSSEVLRGIDPRGYFSAFFREGVFPDGRGLLDEQKLVFKVCFCPHFVRLECMLCQGVFSLNFIEHAPKRSLQQGECGGVGSSVVSTQGVTVSCTIQASVSLVSDGPLISVQVEPTQQLSEKDAEDFNNVLLSLFLNDFFVLRDNLKCLDELDRALPLEWQLQVTIKILSLEGSLLDPAVCAIVAALHDTKLPSISLNHAEEDESVIEKSQIKADYRTMHKLILEEPLMCCSFGIFVDNSLKNKNEILLLAPSQEAISVCRATCSVVVGKGDRIVLIRERGRISSFSLLKITMRYFGSYNRNKGLFTESKDIMAYQTAKEDDQRRRKEASLEVDTDTHVGMWLLCFPDNDLATAMFTTMHRLAEELELEVTHDDIISWLGTAIRCHPSHLVPRGEATTIREKPTLPADPRGGDWNVAIGVTQACLLMQYLTSCKLDKLTADERANVIFAVLRIFSDSDEVAASQLAQKFLRRLYTTGNRVENIEAIAAIFYQLFTPDDIAAMANSIRTLWKITGDEPLVMRLTVEILMCLCQRSEIVASLPDFTMGDQMYCKQVKMIILDLTSDAHEQVPEVQQKHELSTLVNDLFNLKK